MPQLMATVAAIFVAEGERNNNDKSANELHLLLPHVAAMQTRPDTHTYTHIRVYLSLCLCVIIELSTAH